MLKFIAGVFILILLITGAVYLVFRSSFFQVAGIEVAGSQRSEEIIRELRLLIGSENIVFWSPKAIRKIPQSLFWLSDLTLKRDWSAKKIVIEVKEREPWLIWCLLDSCYWLDKTGVAFAWASQAEGFIIPKVLVENGQPLTFGQPFFSNPDLVKNTLAIIKQLQDSSLSVSQFLIKDVNLQEMAAETSGPELYFSLRSLSQNLGSLLANLSERIDFQKLGYIDFRVENRIYYK